MYLLTYLLTIRPVYTV